VLAHCLQVVLECRLIGIQGYRTIQSDCGLLLSIPLGSLRLEVVEFLAT
jgi:hypothetical protein